MALAESASRFELAPIRENFSHIPEVLPLPNLIQTQTDSFEWFVSTGLRELLDEITPITDFTGKNLELHFREFYFEDPKFSEEECRTRDLTYARPLKVEVDLVIKETDEVKHQTVFMGDFPWMTDQGTFIINGAERVVVSQLVRSPGVYYTAAEDPSTGRLLHAAKVIPNRGAWLEFETSNKDLLSVKVDRKRKIPVTTLLRAVGLETSEIEKIFAPADDNPEHPYIALTLEKDPTGDQDQALIEVYKKLRPGDPPTVENARALVTSLFFNFRRYDLGRVGRYKLNKALGEVAAKLKIDLPAEDAPNPRESRVISREDIEAIIGKLIELNNGRGDPDDIDHLGNRRIRANGELIQNQFRIGLLRMERVVKERMTITDSDQATPNTLINIRPVVAAMKEFFGGSQLSQFMDQTNPLAELTNKRRLSALGPGGLSRERAGFDVRDVHPSHYGRMCPIETPEGPNIGLIGSLATYGKINKHGFIETPYRKVRRFVGSKDKQADALGPDPGRGPGPVRRRQARREGRRHDRRQAVGPDQGRQGRPGPDPAGRHRRDRVPRCVRGGEVPHRAGQRRARRELPLLRGPGAGPLQGQVPRGDGRRDRLHGRLAEADRQRRHGDDPVPRARRREPGPDGLEHDAPVGPAPPAGGSGGRHGRRVPRRPRLAGRPGGQGRRHRRVRHGRLPADRA